VENFGRVVEMKGVRIISIMLGYMADNAEDIRNISKKVGQSLIIKMSSFSVKILLPELLKGLEEEQNWRIKISYIWILGIMANCSAKQLQTSLPIIVPTLSTCLSNAHPTIREKASEALNLIGETIKNPEISQCVDILIEALENPF
jgi:HEAT repeat protein